MTSPASELGNALINSLMNIADKCTQEIGRQKATIEALKQEVETLKNANRVVWVLSFSKIEPKRCQTITNAFATLPAAMEAAIRIAKKQSVELGVPEIKDDVVLLCCKEECNLVCHRVNLNSQDDESWYVSV